MLEAGAQMLITRARACYLGLVSKEMAADSTSMSNWPAATVEAKESNSVRMDGIMILEWFQARPKWVMLDNRLNTLLAPV